MIEVALEAGASIDAHGAALMASRSPIPVGVNLTTIGVSAALVAGVGPARSRRPAFDGLGVGPLHELARLKSPSRRARVLDDCSRPPRRARLDLRVGSFVTNVMNRHPAVLARMVATVAALAGAGDRVELGIGIGGHPAEHEAYGIDFPEPRERARHLEEAVEVLRLLLGGGPVDFEGPFHRLSGAHAFPVPQPRPRLIVGARDPGRRADRCARRRWPGTLRR